MKRDDTPPWDWGISGTWDVDGGAEGAGVEFGDAQSGEGGKQGCDNALWRERTAPPVVQGAQAWLGVEVVVWRRATVSRQARPRRDGGCVGQDDERVSR